MFALHCTETTHKQFGILFVYIYLVIILRVVCGRANLRLPEAFAIYSIIVCITTGGAHQLIPCIYVICVNVYGDIVYL